jgi:hypothetical protein
MMISTNNLYLKGFGFEARTIIDCGFCASMTLFSPLTMSSTSRNVIIWFVWISTMKICNDIWGIDEVFCGFSRPIIRGVAWPIH